MGYLPTNELSNIMPIENCIYNIRGKQVMLDSDIAVLFQVEPKYINRQMKRNIERFPDDFCFQLNSIEFKFLRSQNATFNVSMSDSNDLRCQNVTTNNLSSKRRYNPYVYTEHGILALAGVLKSNIANKMSVEIVRVEPVT